MGFYLNLARFVFDGVEYFQNPQFTCKPHRGERPWKMSIRREQERNSARIMLLVDWDICIFGIRYLSCLFRHNSPMRVLDRVALAGIFACHLADTGRLKNNTFSHNFLHPSILPFSSRCILIGPRNRARSKPLYQRIRRKGRVDCSRDCRYRSIWVV